MYSPKIFNLKDVNIPSKYATAHLLHKEKLNDLKRLQCLLDLKGRAWVDTVVAQQKDLQDKGRHRTSKEDESDDPDSTKLDYCPLQCTANIQFAVQLTGMAPLIMTLECFWTM